MFKRTLSALAVGAVLAASSLTSAQAAVLTVGNYKINFDNFDIGTTGYGNTAGIKCTTVAGCDSVAQTTKSTWDSAGILSISSISNISTGLDEYIRGTASSLSNGVVVGPYLTGVFGGFDDYFVEVQVGATGPTTTTLAQGGSFSIYNNASNWDPANPGGSGLTGMTYAGINGSSVFLSGVFAAGVLGLSPNATYLTNYNSDTLAGNAQGFIDFTGGDAFAFFNTNGVTTNNGTISDAFLTTTFDDLNNAASNMGWDVKSTTQVSGAIQAIPEPGSLALMSLALLGLGAVTARRNSKKN